MKNDTVDWRAFGDTNRIRTRYYEPGNRVDVDANAYREDHLIYVTGWAVDGDTRRAGQRMAGQARAVARERGLRAFRLTSGGSHYRNGSDRLTATYVLATR